MRKMMSFAEQKPRHNGNCDKKKNIRSLVEIKLAIYDYNKIRITGVFNIAILQT